MKPWTRDITEVVIKAIFEDGKRNDNARPKAALKRAKERAKERAEKVCIVNLCIPYCRY
jgi:glutamine synthetase